MNIILSIVQAVLALLFGAGGATKAFNFESLAANPAMSALPQAVWRAIGLLELVGAVLLILPAALKRMPMLTPATAALLTIESIVLSVIYAMHSTELAPTNPLMWSALVGILSAFVAYGRRGLYRLK